MVDGSISYLTDSGPALDKASPLPVWARVLLPSISDLIFIALLALLVLTPLSVRLLGDAGIGWHIRTGQQMLATHSIPRVDSFSSTMTGQPWFAWEWLYDLVAGVLDRWWGLNGVVLFTALMIAAVFAGAFRLLVRRGTNVLLALVMVLLAASASMIHFLARPHVVSWLFTLLWWQFLESSGAERPAEASRQRRMLWMLPVLMAIWVNVHGGFLIGFVLLGIYWIDAVWSWLASGEQDLDDLLRKLHARRRTLDLTAIGLLSLAASFANPYGWKLHIHIYRYLSDSFLMNHIDEFQSPNFHGVSQKCFAALLLLTLVAFAARVRPLQLKGVLVVLFAVYSGLYASRNIPVSSLLLVIVIGPLLSQICSQVAKRRGLPLGIGHLCARATAFSSRMGEIEQGLRSGGWASTALIVIFFILVNHGRLGATQWMDAHFDNKRFPVVAVNYLENYRGQNNVPSPILSPDYWGGYLIYRLYPQVLVTVDDRHDLYGSEFFKSYLKMIHVEPGWKFFLHEHEADCLLLPKESPLANAIAASADWKAIYTDEVAIAFVRRTP